MSDDGIATSEAVVEARPSVLVIDDESVIRDLFREVLQEWGYATETAATGEAGLELVRRKSFDIVLTDYLMPGMTGYEVALAVQRESPATAVILITGSASDEQLTAARRSNITVLCKPVHLEQLKVALRRATGVP